MRVFLIAGKAGSGKNEVAKVIKKYLPNTVVTSLSKYIKLFALELTDWDGKEIKKPRTFLQNMGDTLREIEEDFLLKRMEEDLLVYEKLRIENVVVGDIRLLHEIEYMKKRKDLEIITIRVNTDTNTRDLKEREKRHLTEIDLDTYTNFDYVLKNNFDKKLEEEVKTILKGMK